MNDENDDVNLGHKQLQSESELRDQEQIEIELSDYKYKNSEDNELVGEPFAMEGLGIKQSRSEFANGQIDGPNQTQRESMFLSNRLT